MLFDNILISGIKLNLFKNTSMSILLVYALSKIKYKFTLVKLKHQIEFNLKSANLPTF